MLEALADKLAELKGKKVIASSITDNRITFVLEAGPKLSFNEAELTAALEDPARELLGLLPLRRVGSDLLLEELGDGAPVDLVLFAEEGR